MVDRIPETKVVNIKNEPCDIYIGRGPVSIWGNPYKVGRFMTREEAIERYEKYIRQSLIHMDRIHELRGKTLGCFCHPLPCHGDVLVKLVHELEEKENGKALRN